MRSTFYGLEVARSGLYTAQNELNVTGHNIANVDTVGFTRQRLLTSALPALSMNVQISIDTRATAGRGVEAITVDQIRSAFTDAKYRTEASATGYWETRMNEFSMVEQLLDNSLAKEGTAASVHNSLIAFRTALSELTKGDNSASIRTVVQQAGMDLAESINYIYGKLEEQHNNANTAIAVTVDRINDIADTIANLNRQIFGYELTGSKANDLRDSRNLLLDELAGLVDMEYFTNSKGQMVVTIGGRELVSGADSFKLAIDTQGADNKLDLEGGVFPVGKQYTVCWADALGNPGQKVEDKLRFTGGALKAYFDIRDGDTAQNIGIPYVVQQLNELCRKIAREVNEMHRQGYTMPLSAEQALGFADALLTHDMEENPPGSGIWVANTQADGKYTWLDMQTVTDPITGVEYYESVQGIDFFYAGENSDYKTITAKNFRLSDEVLNSVNMIAASSTKMQIPDEGWPSSNQFFGNTENMLNITALYDKKNSLGQDDNFESVLKSIIVTVANESKHLYDTNSAQQIRMRAYVQERASTSAVSLDEEMTNVVRFTHAYNASARVITAIDEQLDTIINKMGMVGR